MKRNEYTEMFKSAKKKSEKENSQVIDAFRRILSNNQVCSVIKEKALYSPFTEPKH